jgi:hypothetical protein
MKKAIKKTKKNKKKRKKPTDKGTVLCESISFQWVSVRET